jgi:transcriptional regulator with XRE-family HTH domain
MSNTRQSAALEQWRRSGTYEADITQWREEFWTTTLSHNLNRLRRRRGMTQKKMAEALGISQPGVCQRLKKPGNIANLADLVQAMGGRLDVVVYVDGEEISLFNGRITPHNEDETYDATDPDNNSL